MSQSKKFNRRKNRTTRENTNNHLCQNEGDNSIEIKQSKILGRYLVSTKSLNAGEIVLVDNPIAVGPCQEANPLCLGCYVNIDLHDPKTYVRCIHCSWPLCSANCTGMHQKYGHSKEECQRLSKSSIKKRNIESFQRFYYALTPFRCLILGESNLEAWQVIQAMETHTEERKKEVDLWKTNQESAVNVIRRDWGLEEYKEDDIHFVCGVLEVNAFEVNVLGLHPEPGGQCLRAIYPTAFLFAHDCVPNVCRSNGKQFQMIFRTITPVAAGETISISYTYTLQSSLRRRQHLRKTKFFSCECRRCKDPTELGTFIGAMKCQKCTNGVLLPKNPLCDDSPWICTGPKCTAQSDVSSIVSTLDRFCAELDSIPGNDVAGYENFLTKCQHVFHKNHYLCLSAMHCLSQIYGKINEYLINNMTDDQLERKANICRNLIQVFEKLEPGLSKERGILLYELHAPLMVLLRRKCETKAIRPKEIKLKIKQVLKYLEEATIILSKEPENSPEKLMMDAAQKAVASLKQK